MTAVPVLADVKPNPACRNVTDEARESTSKTPYVANSKAADSRGGSPTSKGFDNMRHTPYAADDDEAKDYELDRVEREKEITDSEELKHMKRMLEHARRILADPPSRKATEDE